MQLAIITDFGKCRLAKRLTSRTLYKIHGTRGEFASKLISEMILKWGQFSLTTEGSILTGLLGAGKKMLSISSKTFKIRVWKSEY